jgi:RNA polymerase sigma-70 factor (ECF subfamily)
MNETPSQRKHGTVNEFDSEASEKLRLTDEQILAKRIAERARSAWPFSSIDERGFVKYVLTIVDRTLPAQDALRQLAIEDLFLAYACSLGDKKALKAFAKECDGELQAVANKLRISNSDFDDIRQGLWDKLFLASGDRPAKILEYRGTGQLRHWFRVLAARSILNDLRKSKRFENLDIDPGDSALWRTAPQIDPELANIRQRYKEEFRFAFECAVKALEPEERNLLRGYYVGGMSTDQLARAFGIHKATAARHVAKAREKLLDHTRTQLKSKLGANSEDLDSVMRLFDGEMSISLSRLLK